MWYFSWILGLGFAVAVAIIAAITLETNYAFGQRDEAATRRRFELARLGDDLDDQGMRSDGRL